jgi:hypothetical protein
MPPRGESWTVKAAAAQLGLSVPTLMGALQWRWPGRAAP